MGPRAASTGGRGHRQAPSQTQMWPWGLPKSSCGPCRSLGQNQPRLTQKPKGNAESPLQSWLRASQGGHSKASEMEIPQWHVSL